MSRCRFQSFRKIQLDGYIRRGWWCRRAEHGIGRSGRLAGLKAPRRPEGLRPTVKLDDFESFEIRFMRWPALQFTAGSFYVIPGRSRIVVRRGRLLHQHQRILGAASFSTLFGDLNSGRPFISPGGGLFYRPMYAVFGFHPLPFRIAVVILLSVNFSLLAIAVWQLTGSRWATIVALILSINPELSVRLFRHGRHLRRTGFCAVLVRIHALRAYAEKRPHAGMAGAFVGGCPVHSRVGREKGNARSCCGGDRALRALLASTAQLETECADAFDWARGAIRRHRRDLRCHLHPGQTKRSRFAVAEPQYHPHYSVTLTWIAGALPARTNV